VVSSLMLVPCSTNRLSEVIAVLERAVAGEQDAGFEAEPSHVLPAIILNFSRPREPPVAAPLSRIAGAPPTGSVPIVAELAYANRGE
jgi:hypothetical protein